MDTSEALKELATMYPEDFTAWWLTYPRKVGKRKALTCWEIAVKEIAQERGISRQQAIGWLLERTQIFAGSAKGQSGEYCPHPTTWLNQGRYDDDIDEWGKSRKAVFDFDMEGWRP